MYKFGRSYNKIDLKKIIKNSQKVVFSKKDIIGKLSLNLKAEENKEVESY